MTSAPRHFLVATFSNEDALRAAARQVRDRGCRIHDVYTPYPVHGMDELIGIRHSRLPVATLLGGLAGCATALAMQFYIAVFDWPLNVGGKPDNSTLAFIPICFELSVLFGGLATVAALLLRARLYPGKKPWLVHPGITNDTFALVLRKPSDDEPHQRALALLQESGAASITESEAEL